MIENTAGGVVLLEHPDMADDVEYATRAVITPTPFPGFIALNYSQATFLVRQMAL